MTCVTKLDSQVRIELTIIVLQTIPLTIWVLGAYLVWNVGLEPTTPAWKAGSLPINLIPHGGRYENRTRIVR